MVGALDVKLTEEEMKYLEEPYKPVPVSGHLGPETHKTDAA